MKITLQLKDLIYVVIIIAICLFFYKKYVPDEEEQVARLESQRDSIVKVEGLKHKIAYDSLIALADKNLQTGRFEIIDSIKQHKLNHEISKIKHNTPATRRRVVDSILKVSN